MTHAGKAAGGHWRRLGKLARLLPVHLIIIAVVIVFVYPFFWLFISCFKTNAEIFADPLSLPRAFDFSVFANAWAGSGQYTYTTFFFNTLKVVLPVVFFTLVTAVLIAYGFARFSFKGKRIFFTLMLSTMMLPNVVLMIPRYIMFSSIGWVNTYLPLIVPALFGGSSFFIYLLVQFMRGIPTDLDEAAEIDGCGSLRTLVQVILPLTVPALFSAGVFQFIWTWNDFFNQMLYLNSVSKYTISLGLRMSLDATTNVEWGRLFCMCLVSIIPPFLLFFVAQRYLMDGIATTGLK